MNNNTSFYLVNGSGPECSYLYLYLYLHLHLYLSCLETRDKTSCQTLSHPGPTTLKYRETLSQSTLRRLHICPIPIPVMGDIDAAVSRRSMTHHLPMQITFPVTPGLIPTINQPPLASSTDSPLHQTSIQLDCPANWHRATENSSILGHDDAEYWRRRLLLQRRKGPSLLPPPPSVNTEDYGNVTSARGQRYDMHRQHHPARIETSWAGTNGDGGRLYKTLPLQRLHHLALVQ